MMETMLEGWTEPEQAVAREAFDRAYGRAVDQLVASVQARAAALASAETVWQLHDFLSIERHTMCRLVHACRSGPGSNTTATET